ncbi:hypothetical protein HK103_005457 [Boothiomyces macroporosus]|uniref:Ankyrin repeat protein n=1 Tax=Boothiomyces macroporosus TaxID=261099 RepID=A0AAD5Y7F0_9FUNG|nr:hypothetical protein HK103_005457 [Boothiomyces macroporosus]
MIRLQNELFEISQYLLLTEYHQLWFAMKSNLSAIPTLLPKVYFDSAGSKQDYSQFMHLNYDYVSNINTIVKALVQFGLIAELERVNLDKLAVDTILKLLEQRTTEEFNYRLIQRIPLISITPKLLLGWCAYGYLKSVEYTLDSTDIPLFVRNQHAICRASEFGHLEVVKRLLRDPRVDPTVNSNYSVVYACKNGHDKVVKHLLQYPNVDPSDGENYAIVFASENGHLETVKLLLADSRVDSSTQRNKPLRFASKNGHLEIVELLLQSPNVDPSAENNNAIHRALEHDHLEIVDVLLKDTRVIDSLDVTSLITAAASKGHYSLIQKLVPFKPDFSASNYAIQLACEHGHLEIAKLLIEQCNSDPAENDNYPLIYASMNGHFHVVEYLFTKNTDPSADQNAAIRYAAKNGHLNIVQLLLNDKRVNPADKDNYAIQLAAQYGHIEIVKLLLPFVDPSANNNEALIKAKENGHDEIVELLISDGRVDSQAVGRPRKNIAWTMSVNS